MLQGRLDVSALLLLDEFVECLPHRHCRDGLAPLSRLARRRRFAAARSLGKIMSSSHKAQARSIAFSSSRTLPGIIVVAKNIDRFRIDLLRFAAGRARPVSAENDSPAAARLPAARAAAESRPESPPADNKDLRGKFRPSILAWSGFVRRADHAHVHRRCSCCRPRAGLRAPAERAAVSSATAAPSSSLHREKSCRDSLLRTARACPRPRR